MGGLIKTIGTRMLIEHFNHEFRDSRIEDIRTEPSTHAPKGPNIQEYFKTNKDLKWLTVNIKHGHALRNDGLCFLPVEHKDRSSPSAIARWRWFIDQANIKNFDALIAQNHVDICDAIYTGLTGAYDRIEFDAIDGTLVKGAADQFVLAAEEKDPNGARYYKIVLVTPPIPITADGPSHRPRLDDQPGDP
jgi:hypothetical protein